MNKARFCSNFPRDILESRFVNGARMYPSDDELDQLIDEANENTRSGRLERLRFLFSEEYPNRLPVEALAYEYYQEARLCWYMGAFVATIVMSQLAFEELLRSHYRVAEGVGRNLDDHIKVDEAGFKDLIKQSEADGWLHPEETALLSRIRKDFRNPYVHPHDFDVGNRLLKPNFLGQLMKIVAGELVGSGAEDEARQSIRTLVTLFPTIARRFWDMA